MSLKPVLDILNQIDNTSKKNEKLEIIKKYKDHNDFKQVVELTLNVHKRFNTTNVTHIDGLTPDFKQKYLTDDHDSLWKMLDYLTTKSGALDSDIKWLSLFASYDHETVEVIKRVVTKKLKVGAGIKTFRKIFPELPFFGVMLCTDELTKYLKKNDFRNLCWSIKIDGVRTIVEDGKYLSRNGLEYCNFSCFNNELKEFNKIYQILSNNSKNIIPDGEIITFGFEDLMTKLRSAEFDDSNFAYNLFDIAIDGMPFKDRYILLYNIFKYATDNNIIFNRLKLVEHHMCYPKYTSEAQILQLIDDVCERGEEGIVLKKLDSFYVRDQRLDWCKGKQFLNSTEQGLEIIVDGFNYGTGKYSKILGALKCHYLLDDKQIHFNVGSGFTDKERVDLMNNLPDVVEIKYQNLSSKNVPRIPIFIRPRFDKDSEDCHN